MALLRRKDCSGMSDDALRLLELILDEAEKTQDGYLIGVKVSDDLAKIKSELCDELVRERYIREVSYFGKDSVRCKLNI